MDGVTTIISGSSMDGSGGSVTPSSSRRALIIAGGLLALGVAAAFAVNKYNNPKSNFLLEEPKKKSRRKKSRPAKSRSKKSRPQSPQ